MCVFRSAQTLNLKPLLNETQPYRQMKYLQSAENAVLNGPRTVPLNVHSNWMVKETFSRARRLMLAGAEFSFSCLYAISVEISRCCACIADWTLPMMFRTMFPELSRASLVCWVHTNTQFPAVPLSSQTPTSDFLFFSFFLTRRRREKLFSSL